LEHAEAQLALLAAPQEALDPVQTYKDKTHRRQCKILSSKKIELERDFATGVYCLRRIFIRTGNGGGGRVEPERRLEEQQFTKLG
jgi:hypothetical protein